MVLPKVQLSSESLPLTGNTTVSGAQSSTAFVLRGNFLQPYKLAGLRNGLGCKYRHSPSTPPLLSMASKEISGNEEEEKLLRIRIPLDESLQEKYQDPGLVQTEDQDGFPGGFGMH